MEMVDVLIIGAGPAGLTAALYALRAGLRVTILEKSIYGGQVSITDVVENYPGIESISGIELAKSMYEQVTKLCCKIIFETARAVELNSDVKKVRTASKELEAKTLIIANGLKRRTLGCKGEEEFSGRGVSYCATCDGNLYKDKDVIIVGGGNTALEDALYLSNICKSVKLVVRKNLFRGEKYLIDSVHKKDNIECLMESKIAEIKGERAVKSVVIRTGADKIKELEVSGVFIAIGYEPDNKIYEGQLDLDKNGYFISNEECKTNIEGVYVAGDCRLKPLRQIVTAVSDGAIAGTDAIRFVLSKN